MKRILSLAGLIIALSHSHAATLFQVGADIHSLGLGWRLAVNGAYVTPEYEYSESVIDREESLLAFNPFWDTLASSPGAELEIRTHGGDAINRFSLGTVDATGLQYLHVVFDSETHVTVRGLDALDVPDVGPVKTPDGGATAGLLGLAVSAVALIRRRD